MRIKRATLMLFALCVAGGTAGFMLTEGTLSIGSEYANRGTGYAIMFASGLVFVIVRRLRRAT